MSTLKLTSDTLNATATAGEIEYDGKILVVTPQGTQRGVIPGAQFYRLNADLAGANATGAQNIFGVGVTLSSSTVYAFEAGYALQKTAGVTSHNFSIGFGGTATLNNILHIGMGSDTSNTTVIDSTPLSFVFNTASSTVLVSGIANASETVSLIIRGSVSVNAGGTFIPQYTLSAAPGGAYTTIAGSYFLIYPIGASGAATNVGTWA